MRSCSDSQGGWFVWDGLGGMGFTVYGLLFRTRKRQKRLTSNHVEKQMGRAFS